MVVVKFSCLIAIATHHSVQSVQGEHGTGGRDSFDAILGGARESGCGHGGMVKRLEQEQVSLGYLVSGT